MGLIDIVKGNSLRFVISLVNATKCCDKVIFTIKETINDTTPAIQKTLNNGITRIDDCNYTIEIKPEDSKKLDGDSYYLYDLVIVRGFEVKTIASGKMHVLENITQLLG